MVGKGRLQFFRDPTGSDERDTLDELSPATISDAVAQFERIWAENQKILHDRTRGYEIQRDMTDEELKALRDLGYAE